MKNKNSNFFKIFFIILYCCYSFINFDFLSFRHDFIIDSNNVNTYNLSLSKVLNLIDQNQKINLNIINLHKDQLSIDFKCYDLETFYNLLDLISLEINDRVKRICHPKYYILNIRIPWKIKKNLVLI